MMTEERDDYDMEDRHHGGQEGTRDRELLEAAAKAAGICLHPSVTKSYGQWGSQSRCNACDEITDDLPRWSPLTDYGDALQLAMMLHMTISDQLSRINVFLPHGGTSTRGMQWTEDYRDDPMPAVCRAIVRAAATIGTILP